MPLANLREFLGAIDAAGDLRRIEHPVSVDKEITEVADRCMKSPGGGPALLFTAPTLTGGAMSRYPAAVNLFGSERRLSLALRVEWQDRVPAAAHRGRDFSAEDGQPSGMPGYGAQATRCGPHAVARADLLARGRRSLYHTRRSNHEEPGIGSQERGDVPRPGAREEHARDALAAP